MSEELVSNTVERVALEGEVLNQELEQKLSPKFLMRRVLGLLQIYQKASRKLKSV